MRRPRGVDQRARSASISIPEALMQVFEAHGMHRPRAPPSHRYQAMMRDVERLIARRNETTDGRVLFDDEYLLVVAQKA